MELEEVELVPAGLITCLIDNKEVRILKLSPKSITVRLCDKIEDIKEVKIAFYNFNKNIYKELILEEYSLIKEEQLEFQVNYSFSIEDGEYLKSVREAFANYYRYIRLRAYSEDNDFSKEMMGYPSEKDYDFYEDYTTQKKEWSKNLSDEKYDNKILSFFELALNIDNYDLYRKYLSNDICKFKDEYFKENFIENHKIYNKEVSRIYIGNEFCHNLFPSEKILLEMMEKANKENLEITVCFTYMRECYINKTSNLIDKIYKWCINNNKKIEIVINDWGMIDLLQNKLDYFTLVLGVLLNKRKKDPRFSYKKGYKENKGLLSENSLNSKLFSEFLKENNIERYEYESCGYQLAIAEGKHTMHIPFYVTNTSQYCTLYAMCTTMDRGNQKLVDGCSMYCRDYIFLYPKHLQMVGRYNSLFAFDDTLLKDSEILEKYISNGIDRILLNFI